MNERRTVVAGLLAGIIAAVVLLAGIVALAPGRVPAAAATASPPPSAASPSAPTSATATPRGSADPSATVDPLVSGFHVGEPAPPLVVPQVGGGTIDLAALRGTPVWVNFMGTYCPPCRDEFPQMNRFAARYAEHGLVVIAIDVREEEGVVATFAQSLNATFPIGLDLDGSAQRAWDALFLPIHFWVDAEGIIRDGALGGIGPDTMARGVSRILPGVEVTP